MVFFWFYCNFCNYWIWEWCYFFCLCFCVASRVARRSSRRTAISRRRRRAFWVWLMLNFLLCDYVLRSCEDVMVSVMCDWMGFYWCLMMCWVLSSLWLVNVWWMVWCWFLSVWCEIWLLNWVWWGWWWWFYWFVSCFLCLWVLVLIVSLSRERRRLAREATTFEKVGDVCVMVMELMWCEVNLNYDFNNMLGWFGGWCLYWICDVVLVDVFVFERSARGFRAFDRVSFFDDFV